jgi:hypothetical protein
MAAIIKDLTYAVNLFKANHERVCKNCARCFFARLRPVRCPFPGRLAVRAVPG